MTRKKTPSPALASGPSSWSRPQSRRRAPEADDYRAHRLLDFLEQDVRFGRTATLDALARTADRPVFHAFAAFCAGHPAHPASAEGRWLLVASFLGVLAKDPMADLAAHCEGLLAANAPPPDDGADDEAAAEGTPPGKPPAEEAEVQVRVGAAPAAYVVPLESVVFARLASDRVADH